MTTDKVVQMKNAHIENLKVLNNIQMYDAKLTHPERQAAINSVNALAQLIDSHYNMVLANIVDPSPKETDSNPEVSDQAKK